MIYDDYYAETVTTSTASSGMGRGAKAVSVVTSINPFKAVATLALAWGTISGMVNYRRYKKGLLTKSQAIKITASETTGLGVAATMGLLADTVAKAILLGSTLSFVPFAVGVTVTSLTKITWDCKTGKNMMWCGSKPCKLEPIVEVVKA